MLSYLHAYHAGNLADIHKHGALASLLAKMTSKPKPLTYMETHAGRGLYDLSGLEAQKTGEAEAGIKRLLAAGLPPPKHPFRQAIKAAQARFGANFYPGSPLIARFLLGPENPIHLMELHPAEQVLLRRNLQSQGVHIHKRDGFEGVLGISPPMPRRGMVLIDPSYEVKTEYQTAADFALALHRKWPQAVIVLWYPLLDAGLHEEMTSRLLQANLPGFKKSEARFKAANTGGGINGSGLIIVNTPFGAGAGLKEVESWLAGPLADAV